MPGIECRFAHAGTAPRIPAYQDRSADPGLPAPSGGSGYLFQRLKWLTPTRTFWFRQLCNRAPHVVEHGPRGAQLIRCRSDSQVGIVADRTIQQTIDIRTVGLAPRERH